MQFTLKTTDGVSPFHAAKMLLKCVSVFSVSLDEDEHLKEVDWGNEIIDWQALKIGSPNRKRSDPPKCHYCAELASYRNADGTPVCLLHKAEEISKTHIEMPLTDKEIAVNVLATLAGYDSMPSSCVETLREALSIIRQKEF